MYFVLLYSTHKTVLTFYFSLLVIYLDICWYISQLISSVLILLLCVFFSLLSFAETNFKILFRKCINFFFLCICLLLLKKFFVMTFEWKRRRWRGFIIGFKMHKYTRNHTFYIYFYIFISYFFTCKKYLIFHLFISLEIQQKRFTVCMELVFLYCTVYIAM